MADAVTQIKNNRQMQRNKLQQVGLFLDVKFMHLLIIYYCPLLVLSLFILFWSLLSTALSSPANTPLKI
jgi:hypothetical protein